LFARFPLFVLLHRYLVTPLRLPFSPIVYALLQYFPFIPLPWGHIFISAGFRVRFKDIVSKKKHYLYV